MTADQTTTHPRPFAGFGDEAGLDLDLASPRVAAQVVKRLLSPDFEDWSTAVARVGSCTNPIHLTGSSTRVDAATGEVLSSYSSDSEPLGTTLIRCGNRRADKCPSCSRVYAADMFHLIRAGVAGGKGVPERVGENPLVFATLTAPSFGHVHGKRDNGRACRPHAKTHAVRARPAHDVPREARGRGRAAGAAAVLGVLRLRLPHRVAVVGPRAVAPVHHRPQTTRWPNASASGSPSSTSTSRCSTPRWPSTNAAA